MIVTSLIDRADGYFDADGVRRDDGYFYKDELAAYGEFGLTDTYTLIGRVAWQHVDQRFGLNRDSAQGFAASELGLRRALVERDHQVLSGQVSLFLPGDGENVSNQPLGTGEISSELRLLAGQALGEAGFADVQLAYRQRNGEFLDEVRLDGTLGWSVHPDWQVIASVQSVFSAGEAQPGIPEFFQIKAQASVVWTWGDIDIELGGYVTPAGESALDERALFLSTWRRF